MSDLKVVNQPINQPTLSLAKKPVNQPVIAGPVQQAQPQKIDQVVSSPINQPKITHIGTADNLQESKMSLSEFAQSIKAKYPQYQDIDDNELATRMLEKYPQYSSKVFVPPVPEVKQPGFGQRLVQGIASPFLRVAATVGGIGSGLGNAAQAIGNKITGDEENYKRNIHEANVALDRNRERDFGYFGKVKPVALANADEGAGEVIKSFADAAGVGAEIGSYAIGGSGSAKLAQLGLKGLIKEGAIQGLKTGLASGAVGGLGSGLQDEDHPFVSGGIGLLTGALGGAALGTLAGVTAPVAGKVIRTGLEKIFPDLKVRNLAGDFYRVVDDYFGKAFKPSIAGKSTPEALEKAANNYRLGIATILDNTPEGNLPKTVTEALDATSAVKKEIFKTYDQLTKAAGERGVTVDVVDIADALDNMANDPRIADITPGTSTYARDIAERLRNRGTYDPLTAQDVLQSLNSRLQAFYRNPDPNNANHAFIDSYIANNIRNKLDDAISQIQDPSYLGLRKQYGALAEVEKVISKQAARLSKASDKGFYDFADVIGAGDLMQGILTGNPVSVARGLAARGVGKYLKYLNDPDRLTAKLFKDGYKVFQEAKDEVIKKIPKKIPKQLSAPPVGAPKASINVPIIASDKPVITNSAEQTIEGLKNSPPLRRVGGPGSRRANRKAGIGKPLLNKKK